MVTSAPSTAEQVKALYEPIRLLDDGFVQLVKHMGNDQFIVETARVTVQGIKKGQSDRGLIRHLMRHEHTSPFEFCVLVFHVRAPIFVVRQWMRHRTWAYSEVSGRYVNFDESKGHVPGLNDLNPEAPGVKQGRAENVRINTQDAQIMRGLIDAHNQDGKTIYGHLRHRGLAKELARTVLTLNTYTEFRGIVSLHNLFRFLKLRTDVHAQKEIRVYAQAIGKIVSSLFPMAWEAFEDYVLQGERLSKAEIEVLRNISTGIALEVPPFGSWWQERGFTEGEYREFCSKMEWGVVDG